jgi:hypothetical protein
MNLTNVLFLAVMTLAGFADDLLSMCAGLIGVVVYTLRVSGVHFVSGADSG